MPLAATITAFYNFSANTKARASQVNANFDVFRGHIIPIDPNTVSSANNTYDLGSSEYRWRNGYINNLISNSITVAKLGIQNTTTSLGEISIDTATSTTEMIFKISGTERFRINSSGYIGNNARTMGLTSSAGIGQIAASSGYTSSSATLHFTGTSTPIANMTLTIQTTGRPVKVGLTPFIDNSASSLLQIESTSTSNLTAGIRFRFFRNNSLISSNTIQIGQQSMTSTAQIAVMSLGPESIGFTDYLAPATTNIYHLEYQGFVSGILTIGYVRLLAYEL